MPPFQQYLFSEVAYIFSMSVLTLVCQLNIGLGLLILRIFLLGFILILIYFLLFLILHLLRRLHLLFLRKNTHSSIYFFNLTFIWNPRIQPTNIHIYIVHLGFWFLLADNRYYYYDRKKYSYLPRKLYFSGAPQGFWIDGFKSPQEM